MADPWEAVDTGVPLLLLPVRVETQSVKDAGGACALRVRIYPDDIAIAAPGASSLSPERFEVIVVQGGRTVAVTGKPVTPDPLSLDLGNADEVGEEAFAERARALRDLATGGRDAPAWLRDYDEAVRLGLAVTVPLLSDATIERLYVIGVRAGGADESAAELHDLLRSHAGAGFVPPGTPTNNTERARARPAPQAVEPGAASGDGARLAAAFGLPDRNALDDWGGGDPSPDVPRALGEALWPVTWEPWIADTFRGRGPDAFAQLDVQDHIADHLRPSGPLPAVRIGAQPYGVLPVTILDELREFEQVETTLTEAVRRADPLWRSAAAPRTVRDGDLRAALPEVLGQAPTSRYVRIRQTLRADTVPLSGIDPDAAARRARLALEIERELGLRVGTLRPVADLGAPRFLGLPLAAQSDPEVLREIAERTDVTGDESVLQVLTSAARARSLARMRRARGDLLRLLDYVRVAETAFEDGDPGQWEWVATGAAEQLVTYAGAVDADLQAVFAELPIRDLFDHDTRTRERTAGDVLRMLREKVPWIARAGRRVPRLRGEAAGLTMDSRAYAREVVAAYIAYLAALDVAARVRMGIAVISTSSDDEHRAGQLGAALDACAYRLDAWETSLATRRLQVLRRDRPDGIAIGAFAWLEDIALSPRAVGDEPQPARSVGWVQAPTRRHAATAAVLRSARLSHAPADGPDDPLELDVSSTRTREATAIVRGIRNGQELGALLGYRFERWLHETDPSRNRFVPALRTVAPLVVGRETPLGAGASDLAFTGAVVDGLALISRRGEAVAAIGDPDRLGEGVRSASVDERAAVGVLIDRLAGVADAVSDLLLAEGVHQLVTGNAARAAAAMDAASGDVTPEEPHIPRVDAEMSGATDRVGVLGAPGAAAAAQGWDGGVRAIAHPFLERWARGILGRADRIAVGRTAGGALRYLSTASPGALDFVLAADGTDAGLARYWARCRRMRPTLPAVPLRPGETAGLPAGRITLGDAWQLACAARAVLTDARGVTPEDLVPSGADASTARFTVDEVALTARLSELASALAAVSAALPDPASASRAHLLAAADTLAELGLGDTTDPETLILPAAAEPGGGDGGPIAASDPVQPLRSFVAELMRTLTARIARVAAAPPDAAEVVLGDVVGTVPVVADLTPPGPGAAPAPLPRGLLPAAADAASIRRWLVRYSTVRAPLARWATLAALRGALGRRAIVRAAVFAPSTAPVRWYGDALPPGGATVTALVFEAMPGFSPTAPMAGLVVDQWTQHRPALRYPSATAAASEAELLVETGLAVHAGAPAARAPQSMLLAVTPDGGPWSSARVVRLLDEVRALLRMRLAKPADIPMLGDLMPAISVGHASVLDEAAIDPRALRAAATFVPSFVRRGS